MCGTYFIDKDLYVKLASKLSAEDYAELTYKDIYPKNKGVIIQDSKYKLVKWGFTVSWTKSKLYNARSETVLSKKIFHDDYINNKCVIIASGFYEFDQNKQKYKYTLKNNVIFMTGFTQTFNGEEEFIILTEAASDEAALIHNRVPQIVDVNQVKHYLADKSNNYFPVDTCPIFTITREN